MAAREPLGAMAHAREAIAAKAAPLAVLRPFREAPRAHGNSRLRAVVSSRVDRRPARGWSSDRLPPRPSAATMRRGPPGAVQTGHLRPRAGRLQFELATAAVDEALAAETGPDGAPGSAFAGRRPIVPLSSPSPPQRPGERVTQQGGPVRGRPVRSSFDALGRRGGATAVAATAEDKHPAESDHRERDPGAPPRRSPASPQSKPV